MSLETGLAEETSLTFLAQLPLTGMAVTISLGEHASLNEEANATNSPQALSKYGWNRHVWDIPFNLLYSARKVSLLHFIHR
jgi:hypothetical protein